MWIAWSVRAALEPADRRRLSAQQEQWGIQTGSSLNCTVMLLSLPVPCSPGQTCWWLWLSLDGSEQEALDLVPLVTNVVLEEHLVEVGWWWWWTWCHPHQLTGASSACTCVMASDQLDPSSTWPTTCRCHVSAPSAWPTACRLRGPHHVATGWGPPCGLQCSQTPHSVPSTTCRCPRAPSTWPTMCRHTECLIYCITTT